MCDDTTSKKGQSDDSRHGPTMTRAIYSRAVCAALGKDNAIRSRRVVVGVAGRVDCTSGDEWELLDGSSASVAEIDEKEELGRHTSYHGPSPLQYNVMSSEASS